MVIGPIWGILVYTLWGYYFLLSLEIKDTDLQLSFNSNISGEKLMFCNLVVALYISC